jgi:hypothetical protein
MNPRITACRCGRIRRRGIWQDPDMNQIIRDLIAEEPRPEIRLNIEWCDRCSLATRQLKEDGQIGGA